MPKSWNAWENIESISEGGQGRVFKVRNSSTGQIGALKLLKNPKRLERFICEIQSASKLDHPNVVPLIDHHLTKEPYYAVFEFVDGRSLEDMASELAIIPLDRRLQWCEQLCEALECAHACGLVHRDIKPANILLETASNTIKLTDFGLVFVEDNERLTSTNEQVGSRFYIPPECEAGRQDHVTNKCDIYSVGKVLYFLVSGGHIFAREAHDQEKYDLTKRLDSPFLKTIHNVLDMTVVVDIERRIPSVAELKERIGRCRQTIMNEIPVPGVAETYKCMFCRFGTYIVVGTTKKGGGNLGYRNEGEMTGEDMLFLECPSCGNCQRFKLKHTHPQKGGNRDKEQWFPNHYN